jgi:hypothetical protein
MEVAMRIASRAGILGLFLSATFAAWAVEPAAACADGYDDESPLFSNIEVALEFGAMDRGTSGVGDPLLGYGYDHSGGALGGLDVRVFFHDSSDYFRHGVTLRGAYAAEDFFGLGGVAFHFGQLDAGYVFRSILPCMSEGDRRVYVSGAIGVTTLLADASTGRGGPDARWNERVVAADALDHVGIGGFLTVDGAIHMRAAFIGVRLDLREHFTVSGGPASRDFSVAALLRGGVNIDL